MRRESIGFELNCFVFDLCRSPVITSSPSEDHTYSAGGGGNGGGSSTTNSATHSQNGSDNNSSGVCSDAAYESGDER